MTPQEMIEQLRSLQRLAPGVTAIANEHLFKEAAEYIEQMETVVIPSWKREELEWVRKETGSSP